MKVWRVAHRTETFVNFPVGPYFVDKKALPDGPDLTLYDMYMKHCDAEHPSPGWDYDLKYIRSDERCGFDSREALDEWFKGYHGVLDTCGFTVWVYESDEYRVGSRGQVLFSALWARSLRNEDLDTVPVQLDLF